MESDKSGRWSSSEAENAVKGAFILESQGRTDPPSLRYSEIQRIIDRGYKKISHKTLSKSLMSLAEKGSLARERKGREVWYTLPKLSREEAVAALVTAERLAIEMTSVLGAIAEPDHGWAFYGVLPFLRRSLRPRLRKEAINFQKRIDEVLRKEAERTISGILRRASGVAAPGVIRAGKRALWDLIERDVLPARSNFTLMFSTPAYVNRSAPGAWGVLKESIGKKIDEDAKREAYRIEHGGGREGDLMGNVDRQKERLKIIESLFSSLTPRDRDWATRQYWMLVAVRGMLCAVVR